MLRLDSVSSVNIKVIWWAQAPMKYRIKRAINCTSFNFSGPHNKEYDILFINIKEDI